jgi:hypothetical protein
MTQIALKSTHPMRLKSLSRQLITIRVLTPLWLLHVGLVHVLQKLFAHNGVKEFGCNKTADVQTFTAVAFKISGIILERKSTGRLDGLNHFGPLIPSTVKLKYIDVKNNILRLNPHIVDSVFSRW